MAVVAECCSLNFSLELLPRISDDSTLLVKEHPRRSSEPSAAEQFKFLRYVVEQEDYATGIRQQVALASGARKMVTFGKNESGGARFHAWVDQLLETSDSELTSLFQAPVDPIAEMLDRTNEGES